MSEPLNSRIAVYPGTFDPIHRGHLDIISRGKRIFDQLIVGVGINPDKQPFFDQEERVSCSAACAPPAIWRTNSPCR